VRISRTVLRGAGGEIPRPTHHPFTVKTVQSGRREVYVQGFVPGQVPAAGIGKSQISAAGVFVDLSTKPSRTSAEPAFKHKV